MWGYKICPRCRGDIYIDDDVDRTYIKCLQCGYEKELTKSLQGRKDRAISAVKRVRVQLVDIMRSLIDEQNFPEIKPARSGK
jgi:hypothetical protein